jgi:nucleoside-diphosphate-sugar epimerase
MDKNLPLLLITGINGYVGSWVTKKALDSKKYRIRGTIRDHTDKEKIELLRDAFGDQFDQIELVSADLLDKDSLAKAVDGCEYVLHVASPFPPANPTDENEDEVIKPAVDGTIGILRACVKSTVKRIVTTSTCGCIEDPSLGDSELDETHWPLITKSTWPYVKGKILAEKASWEFIDLLYEDEKTFEFLTVNPGLIFGPLLIKNVTASTGYVSNMLKGEWASCPLCYFPVVDVRDVADAHIKALEAKPFERYALNSETLKLSEVGEIIRKEFEPMGYNVTYKDMYKFTAWLGSFVDVGVRGVYERWNINCHIKNDKAKKELGINFRPVKESIIDTCYSLINHGLVEDKRPKGVGV